jgi:IS1 family transposase
MNALSGAKRAQIIRAICEGVSVRATARLVGVSKNTVTKLILDVGTAVTIYQDRAFHDLDSTRIECDEIWAYVHTKDKNLHDESDVDHGSIWTYVAIDPDSKLVPTWLVGQRNAYDAIEFLGDLQGRLLNRIQLSTDGHRIYGAAVPETFKGAVDYAVVHKIFGKPREDEARYSPAPCIGIEKEAVIGDPDMTKASTSIVERSNLSLRMSSRRYTRLTNGFSKSARNHIAATALHFAFYNLARPHGTLTKRNGRPTTPAMEAGIEDHVWTADELVDLLDRYEAAA